MVSICFGISTVSASTTTFSSDVSSSLDRLMVHDFLSRRSSGAASTQKLVKVNDGRCDLAGRVGESTRARPLTPDTATNQDDLQLMGLDHPLVQDGTGSLAQQLPPGMSVGIAVGRSGREPELLSLWMVGLGCQQRCNAATTWWFKAVIAVSRTWNHTPRRWNVNAMAVPQAPPRPQIPVPEQRNPYSKPRR